MHESNPAFDYFSTEENHTNTHSRIITLPRTVKLSQMDTLITNRNLTIINFTIVVYFILIWLAHFYQIDFVLIGVFRELLTMPFLIAQIVFLVIGIKYAIEKKRNVPMVISVLALAIYTTITIGSFF